MCVCVSRSVCGSVLARGRPAHFGWEKAVRLHLFPPVSKRLEFYPDSYVCLWVPGGRSSCRFPGWVPVWGGGAVCKGVASNMPTACDHPEVVSEFLEKELRAGRHSSSIGSNTGARNARLDQGGLNQHVQSFF